VKRPPASATNIVNFDVEGAPAFVERESRAL
jgi:hypothetical protein